VEQFVDLQIQLREIHLDKDEVHSISWTLMGDSQYSADSAYKARLFWCYLLRNEENVLEIFGTTKI
jgi:hypothetical protein